MWSVFFCYGRCTRLIFIATHYILYKMKIHSSCEIEDFVETHLCKLCVILRSRALRVAHTCGTWYDVFFFHHPIYYPCTALALPPSSNSDPGSHSGPSSPLPNTVRTFIFVARKSAFSSLVHLRRITPTHAARRSQQFVLFFTFLQIYSKPHHERQESNSRTNACSIRG